MKRTGLVLGSLALIAWPLAVTGPAAAEDAPGQPAPATAQAGPVPAPADHPTVPKAAEQPPQHGGAHGKDQAARFVPPDPAAEGVSGGEGAGTLADDAGPWKLTRAPMPYEIVRSLQFLQDQIARGNDQAIPVQALLLKRFGPVFVDADPEIWSDRRNLRAAALFVLSGGPPSVLRGILARTAFADSDKVLLEGALAYVENRVAVAEKKFAALDLDAMDPGLEAQLSLALGQIEQLDHPQEAIAHLDRARLLAPGGLIEEAALRLEVLIADRLGQLAKADRLARQYFDRYARSSYAANFRARFAAAYATRPEGQETATMADIEDAVYRLPEAEKLSLYLAVGRRALVAGNLQMAAVAATHALQFKSASPEDRERALLYSIASSLTTRSFGEAAATLNAIDPEKLQPPDRELRAAAYSVLDEMRKPAQPSLASSAPDASKDDARTAALASRAKQLLTQVSNDLKDQNP